MILNLAKPEKSEIKFKVSKFPDGQQQVWIESLEPDSVVRIFSRLNNFTDLELIVCAVKSLEGLCASRIYLYVPYFLGSRSDRKFTAGENNYLKDVICPIINSLNLNGVCVLDPHSDVLEACLFNFTKMHKNFYFDSKVWDCINKDNSIFMSPDAGAMKKIYETASNLLFKGEIINCSKIRKDGKIVKTEVPHFDISKDVVIWDDICDGGATFVEIGKVIKARKEQAERDGLQAIGKLYLVVTHGIFSKGFVELGKYFNGVFCTNSYQDIQHPLVKQINIF